MSKIFIFAFALFAVASQAYGEEIQSLVARNFADILLSSNSSPERSVECFKIYNPKLTALTDEYENAHANCMNTAANSKDALNKEVAPNVAAVQGLHENICGGFSKCNPNNNDPYAYFECSNGAAGEAITMSHNIQTTSKDRMQYLQLREQMITYDRDNCTDKCSNKYVEDAAKVHAELQDCLNGKSVPDSPPTYRPETTEDYYTTGTY